MNEACESSGRRGATGSQSRSTVLYEQFLSVTVKDDLLQRRRRNALFSLTLDGFVCSECYRSGTEGLFIYILLPFLILVYG